MLIKFDDGGIVNTDYIIMVHEREGDKSQFTIRFAHTTWMLHVNKKEWDIVSPHIADVSTSEIRDELAQANRDGEIIMHALGKGKNGEGTK